MAQVTRKTYTGIVGTGAQAPIPAPTVFSKYSVQVKGVAVAATSWSVTLEGSDDGVNFTVLITHTTPDGSTQFTADKPCAWMRVNVGALSLGSATSITVSAVASD